MPIPAHRLLFVVLACSLPVIGHTWDYREHFGITLVSFRTACAGLPAARTGESDGFERIRRLCANPYFAICQAHMAALAADYVGETIGEHGRDSSGAPKKRYFHRDQGFLDNGKLDCRDLDGMLDDANSGQPSADWQQIEAFIQSMLGESGAETFCPDPRKKLRIPGLITGDQQLYEGFLGAKFDWGRLALKNYGHFQPDSVARTERFAETANKGTELQARFLNHAYAMHYLEDSFSAGHIGITRKPAKNAHSTNSQEGLRQDYAHAYHDDTNDAGQFLSVDGQQFWFGFGDGNLCAPTYYLEVTPVNSRLLSAKSLMETLGSQDTFDVDAAEWRLSDSFTQALDEALKKSAAKDASWETLSLSKNSKFWSVSVLCTLATVCEKGIFVLGAPPSGSDDYCAPVDIKPSEGKSIPEGLTITSCKSTYWHVMQSAVAAQAAFVRSMDEATHATLEGDPAPSFPKIYRSISAADSDKLLAGELNDEHLVVTYDQDARDTRCDDADTRPAHCNSMQGRVLATKSLGLGISSNYGHRSYLDVQTIYFTLEDSDTAVESPGQEAGQQKGSHVFPVTAEVGLVQRSDDRWRLFNSIGAHYGLVRIPPHDGWFVDFSLHAGIGLDRIWDGPSERNAYVSIGPAMQLEFGRHDFTLRAEFKEHWNEEAGWAPAWMISFGYSVPSLNLTTNAYRESQKAN